MSVDVAAIRARLEAAQAELDRMIDASTREGGSPGYHWRWSIPANPERDSDLILSAPLADVSALLAEVERLARAQGGVRRLAGTDGWCVAHDGDGDETIWDGDDKPLLRRWVAPAVFDVLADHLPHRDGEGA